MQNKDLIKYYSQFNEDGRLSDQWGQLEFERTKQLLTKYLPQPPAIVCDVGGATGIYSFWLAQKQYHVHLVDPVPDHIEQAKTRAAKTNATNIQTCRVGDARNLDFEDSLADAVLLMGPLYHLIEKADRIQALIEAKRVLKQSGILVAVAISKFASTIDGFMSGFFKDEVFRKIMLQDIEDGQHKNPTNNPLYFTDTFFHHPLELTQEVKEAGFSKLNMEAIEGFGYLLPDFNTNWENEEYRAFLLRIIEKVAQDSTLVGASPHIMCIAQK